MLLLLLLVATFVGVPLALNAVAYATTRAARRADCEAEAASRAASVRAFVHESIASVCCLAAWPFAPLLARTPALGAERRGTVMLIAAGAADRASLWLLARRLRRHGWHTRFPMPHRWPEQSEAAQAAIDACVRRAHAAAPAEPLILIAHAAGGLAARDYLRSHPDAPVGMLVTLGTAHQETLAPPFRIRALHGPDGGAVRELAANDPVPDRFDVVAISADLDAWVVPPEAAYYPRAFNVSVAMLGHFGLLVSRKVFDLVLENIEAAPLVQAPRPASTASSTRATSSSSL